MGLDAGMARRRDYPPPPPPPAQVNIAQMTKERVTLYIQVPLPGNNELVEVALPPIDDL